MQYQRNVMYIREMYTVRKGAAGQGSEAHERRYDDDNDTSTHREYQQYCHSKCTHA